MNRFADLSKILVTAVIAAAAAAALITATPGWSRPGALGLDVDRADADALLSVEAEPLVTERLHSDMTRQARNHASAASPARP